MRNELYINKKENIDNNTGKVNIKDIKTVKIQRNHNKPYEPEKL